MSTLRLSAATALALCMLSTPVMAITLPDGQTSSFDALSTAYTSNEFHELMTEYDLQLTLNSVKNVPSTYAFTRDTSIVLNNVPLAYTPLQYHNILMSYGLKFDSKYRRKDMSQRSYVTITDGKAVFAPDSVIFNQEDWENILSMYVQVPQDRDCDGIIEAEDRCPLTPLGMSVNADGCMQLSTETLFDFDSTAIKPEYHAKLRQLGKSLRNAPLKHVKIEGHTDNIGAKAYNVKLSKARAKAVKDFLVQETRVPAERLSVYGYGSSRPLDTANTDAARAKNRRVEFKPMIQR